MAHEAPVFTIPGLSAGASLVNDQYKFVKLSANNTVVLCAAATDRPIGVLQNNPASGQAAEVLGIGLSKVKAGGTIAAGDLVGTDASGLADTKVAGTDTTQFICGQVVLGVTNSGEIGTAFINCANIARAA